MGKNLKLIGRAGTGTDNIDVKAATLHGVIVMNTPNGNTFSAAEHTCALIMSLSRNIPSAVESVKNGKWERSKFMGNELSGKTLAIIGLGRIGREVGTRMASFGMKLIGHDPMISKDFAKQHGIDWLELNEIWPLADYITLHTPLIPQTKDLLNAETFKKSKKGVKIVNCARGGIVNEVDLLNALNGGICDGAALDVYMKEPPEIGDKLIGHPSVICTPHLGANTAEAQMRVAKEMAEKITALCQKKSDGTDSTNIQNLDGIINAPNLMWEFGTDSKPWMKLAFDLGYMIGTIFEPVKKYQLTNNNEKFSNKLESMKAALLDSFITGIMKNHTKNGLNLINAPHMFKQYPGFSDIVSSILMEAPKDMQIHYPTNENALTALWIEKSQSLDDHPFSMQAEVINNQGYLVNFCGKELGPDILINLSSTKLDDSNMSKKSFKGILISRSMHFRADDAFLKEILSKSQSCVIYAIHGINDSAKSFDGSGGIGDAKKLWKIMKLDRPLQVTAGMENQNSSRNLPDGEMLYHF
ncbi:D-3-phosphoglycerate dehydrogenase-like [Gordionus sp. m RMFG-2023]|uniref:D-3-phosphoglycerate dehydrogenase-like n=1 Tax=Gordionus sp. m RMFG-2023 TaxID=3053472 RepID=UPI0031FBFA4D